MHSDETPFEPASPEVSKWVDKLNAMSSGFKLDTVTQANWKSFLKLRFSEIPVEPPSRTSSGAIRFNGLTFVEITFRDLPCFQDSQGHEFRGCEFLKCDFIGWGTNGLDLRNAEFTECRGPQSLRDSNLIGSKFKNCNLRNTELVNVRLNGASIFACDLRGANLSQANLVNADFRAVEVDALTRLNTLDSTKNWRIDRYTIACLSEESGLTIGNRMDMVIRDDVADLRKQFSGLVGFLHLLSLAVFLAPYIWFLVSHWADAKFGGDAANTVPLYLALSRYFVNAGADWQSGFNPNWGWLTLSILILLYNVVRFRLLWKTYDLEAAERISGVPVRFSLTEPVTPSKWLRWFGTHPIWNWLYRANKFGYWLYLGFVALKTWHFLTMRIPLHP